jgi:hypothetical protein
MRNYEMRMAIYGVSDELSLFYKYDYEVVKPSITAGATRGKNNASVVISRAQLSIGNECGCGRLEMI